MFTRRYRSDRGCSSFLWWQGRVLKGGDPEKRTKLHAAPRDDALIADQQENDEDLDDNDDNAEEDLKELQNFLNEIDEEYSEE